MQNTDHLTIEKIQRKVAGFFNVSINELKNARRFKTIAYPRQIAMYLSRKLTNASFPKIGQEFGGKDHSTVINAYRKILKMIESDTNRTLAIVEELERQLQLTPRCENGSGENPLRKSSTYSEQLWLTFE